MVGTAFIHLPRSAPAKKPAPAPAKKPAPAPAKKPAPAPAKKPAPAPAPVSVPVGLKRALVIGVNYVKTPYELYGCINDAVDIQKQLQTFFPSCKEYQLITDETATKPTRANIMAALNWLTSGLKPGENVMFHFSGHGGRVRDTTGDEVTGLDSCIYPINGGRMETITDDDLRTNLAMKIPAGCKLFVILDCCHSGTAVDLRCDWQATSATALSFAENKKYEKTPGTVVFMSGCRDTQQAMDTVNKEGRPCGAMTMALLETWKAYGPAIKFKHLLWDVRKFLREYGYAQIPQLSTGAPYDINTPFNLGS
jgi:hypothetical protein